MKNIKNLIIFTIFILNSILICSQLTNTGGDVSINLEDASEDSSFEIWNTNIGSLDNVNSSQFVSDSGSLSINTSILQSGASASVAGSDTEIQYNDGGSFGSNSNFTFDGNNLNVNNGNVLAKRLISSNTIPIVRLIDTNADTDEKVWDIYSNSGGFYWDATSDDYGSGFSFLSVTRSGITPDQFTLQANDLNYMVTTSVKLLGDLPMYFGANSDSSIKYDGTNFVYDSSEVGSGYHKFLGGDIYVQSENATDTKQVVINSLGSVGGASGDLNLLFKDTYEVGKLTARTGLSAAYRYFGFVAGQDRDGVKYPIQFWTQDAGGTSQKAVEIFGGQTAGTVAGTEFYGKVGFQTSTLTYDVNLIKAGTPTLLIQSTSATDGHYANFFLENDKGWDSRLGYVIYSSGTTGTFMGTSQANQAYLYTAGSQSKGLTIGTVTSDPLTLSTNNAMVATLSSAGNFGIGTASPSYKFHVISNNATSTMRLGYDTSNYADFRITSAGSLIITPVQNLYTRKDGAGIQAAHYVWNQQAVAAGVGTGFQFAGQDLAGMAMIYSGWDAAANTDAYLRFQTRSGGSLGTRMAIESDGRIFIYNKLAFTQTDGNEYIDSLADGYMDYGATTAHRFNNDVQIFGDLDMYNNTITNASYPTGDTDVATKKYVDDNLGSSSPTKELWLTPVDQDATIQIGTWSVAILSNTGQTTFNFRIPNDYTDHINFSVVIIPDTNETIQWDNDVSVSGTGEPYDSVTTHSEDYTQVVVKDIMTELSLNDDFSFLSSYLDAGDYVTVKFDSDTSNIRVVGATVRYE